MRNYLYKSGYSGHFLYLRFLRKINISDRIRRKLSFFRETLEFFAFYSLNTALRGSDKWKYLYKNGYSGELLYLTFSRKINISDGILGKFSFFGKKWGFFVFYSLNTTLRGFDICNSIYKSGYSGELLHLTFFRKINIYGDTVDFLVFQNFWKRTKKFSLHNFTVKIFLGTVANGTLCTNFFSGFQKHYFQKDLTC